MLRFPDGKDNENEKKKVNNTYCLDLCLRKGKINNVFREKTIFQGSKRKDFLSYFWKEKTRPYL